MSFTIQRILGPALVMVLGLLLLTPSSGLAQPRPDLVVSSLSEPPTTAFPGDAFVMTARVSNQGAAAANVSITKFDLIRSPGGTVKNLKGVQNISPLLVGSSDDPAVTLEIYSDTLPGTYQVRACANGVAPKIPESSTTNNCLLSGTITVLEVPDLVVTALSSPPPTVPQGQGFTASFTVQNTGHVVAGASRVKFSLIGVTQIDLKADATELQVGALGAGATFTHAVPLIVRPETAPGLYSLRMCADAGKAVQEASEDNCLTLSGTVEVTPQPDLVVKKVTLTEAPLAVEQGQSVAIEVVVRNDGLRDADPSTLKFVLVSTGPTPLQKNLKGTVPVPLVPAGTKVVLNAIPSVYDETLPGTYTLQGCVDSKKAVAESFENNNCTSATGTLEVTGLEISPADLAVTALTPPPASRLPGETFTLTATVLNHGTGESLSTTSKFYLVSTTGTLRKNLKGTQTVGVLAKDAFEATEVTVAVYSDTVAGDYLLQACADGNKELREVNEDDNCLTSTAVITVSQVPDLVVKNVGDPPADIRPGQSFTLTETVKNIGPVGALASTAEFSLVSTVDPTIIFELSGSLDVKALAPLEKVEGSVVVKVRPETLPGPYKVVACADAKKVIFEGNEDNNCAQSVGVVQVAAVPDLIVNSVKLPTSPSPLVVLRGATVTLTAVVKNQGRGDAGATTVKFSLVITPGAAPIKKMPETPPVLAVVAGGKQSTTAAVTIPTATPPGTYLVQACADWGKTVDESSESNNCGTSAATLQVQ